VAVLSESPTTVARRPGSMVPVVSALPDVLPTDRLGPTAKAKPPLRAGLREIPDLRNALAVVVLLAEAVGLLWLAAWLHHPLGYAAAFVAEGCLIVRFNILGHDAVHRLLFRNRTLNDWVGRWLLSYPAFVAFELYRRGHMSHHRDEFGPDEPDLALYREYPISRDSLRRKLVRDATGISGWKILKGLFRGLGKPRTRPVAIRIFGTQLAIIAVLTLLGHPFLYLLWFGPYMTQWRVTNRLRAISEHGGMHRSSDRRETTHHVRQTLPARVFMVPYNVGYHLAHHVDMGVPCWKLQRFHRELEASGWVTPDLVYPNYRSLWRALSSRPPAIEPSASAPASAAP
jgi:fatty acid desaturase